jgi:transcriptional regulator with XRE-family HTH domain
VISGGDTLLLGERLKQLREEAGLTQQQLANMVNLSQQTIGHYEVNRSEPNVKTIELFARIFNTSTDYLLGLSDTNHPDDVQNKLDLSSLNLPKEALKEIENFTEFMKQKYKNK